MPSVITPVLSSTRMAQLPWTNRHDQSNTAVGMGLDVGKADHDAVVFTTTGTTMYDKALLTDETRLRVILDGLVKTHRSVLLVLHQPAAMKAPSVDAAQSCPKVQGAY